MKGINGMRIEPTDILAAVQGMLHVRAHPHRSKTQVTRWDSATCILYVDVAAPAEGGKANAELVKFLKRYFGRPIMLVRGSASRDKYLRLS